ncbi:MAG: efflux RND transporter periplasmic adaptor subunit [Treponemataceae bacterium]|nr:efflux RND transporter periplasmic adaptor subunit [Treponemataceae bacterium]
MKNPFENFIKNRKPLKRGVKLIIRYTIIIAVAVLILALVIAFLAKSKGSYVPPPPAVEIIQPEPRTINQSVKISGYVEALDIIPVVPFVSGTIKAYPVKEGTKVKKGDLIAKIDDEPYRQQFLQAQAGYLAVKSTYERMESLYKAGATTAQNYDGVKAQHDAVKAQYDLAALQLSYTNVTAPADGTILMANGAVGSIGATTQPIAVIADLTKLVVRLNVPEKYFDLFNQDRENLSAVIRRPGLEDYSEDAVCPAVLETMSSYIQAESKTFKVVFSLKDNLEDFLPGMYIEVVVTYSAKEGILALPLKVLKTDGSCYTYNPETQTVDWLDINSSIRDDKYFAIPTKTEGITKDTYFVISGQDTIFDGQKVTVLNHNEEPELKKTDNEVLSEELKLEAVSEAENAETAEKVEENKEAVSETKQE